MSTTIRALQRRLHVGNAGLGQQGYGFPLGAAVNCRDLSCSFVLQGCVVWLVAALAFVLLWRYLLAPSEPEDG